MEPSHVVHTEVNEHQNHDLRGDLEIIHQVLEEWLVLLGYQDAEDHYQDHH